MFWSLHVARNCFVIQALKTADSVLQGDVLGTYISSSHILEGCLMELLLLPRGDLGSCDSFLQSRVDVNISCLLSAIEQLKPDSDSKKDCKQLVANL